MGLFGWLRTKSLDDESKNELRDVLSAALVQTAFEGAEAVFGPKGFASDSEDPKWTWDASTQRVLAAEFLSLYLCYADRVFFDVLGANKRGPEMDDLVARSFSRIASMETSEPLNRSAKSAERLIADYNNFRLWAWPHRALLPEPSQSPKGTLFWEFGKRLAEILGHPKHAQIIMCTLTVASETITSLHSIIQSTARSLR